MKLPINSSIMDMPIIHEGNVNRLDYLECGGRPPGEENTSKVFYCKIFETNIPNHQDYDYYKEMYSFNIYNVGSNSSKEIMEHNMKLKLYMRYINGEYNIILNGQYEELSPFSEGSSSTNLISSEVFNHFYMVSRTAEFTTLKIYTKLYSGYSGLNRKMEYKFPLNAENNIKFKQEVISEAEFEALSATAISKGRIYKREHILEAQGAGIFVTGRSVGNEKYASIIPVIDNDKKWDKAIKYSFTNDTYEIGNMVIDAKTNNVYPKSIGTTNMGTSEKFFNATYSRFVYMKSPNGKTWKLNISDNGELSTYQVD